MSADFKRFTFKLRPNLAWHDGKPFTADDVKWWFDLVTKGAGARKPSTGAPALAEIVSVEAAGKDQVQLTLKSAGPNFFINLGTSSHRIAHPRHLMEPEIAKGNINVTPLDVGLVGTGPFKLLKYTKGSVISYRRFDQYWDKDEQGRKLPFLDGIDMPIIPDREASVAAFRTGRLDATGRGAATDWLPQQVATVGTQMGDKAYFTPVWGGGWILEFNTLKPGPLQDVRVRKAISLAIDQQEHGDAVYPGFARPMSLWMVDSPWANPDWQTWPGFNRATKQADRAEAKRLLAQAGFPSGFEATLPCTAGSNLDECEFLVGHLRDHLGIRIKIQVVDGAAWVQRACEGNFDLRLGTHGTPAVFPETMALSAASVAVNPCGNLRHDDLRVDEMFKKILASANHEERVKLSREVERYIIQEKVYGTPLVTRSRTYAARSHVKGFILQKAVPEDYLDFSTVWLDK